MNCLRQGCSPPILSRYEPAPKSSRWKGQRSTAIPANSEKLMEAIKSDALISAKKKAIKDAAGQIQTEEGQPSPEAICELLAGAKVRLSKLFPDLSNLFTSTQGTIDHLNRFMGVSIVYSPRYIISNAIFISIKIYTSHMISSI